MPITQEQAKIAELQDALYWAWYGWNSGELSNDKIADKVKHCLTGYAPYEKRRRANSSNKLGVKE